MTTRATEVVVVPDPAPAADPAAEIGADLHAAINRHADWAVKAYRETLEHVEQKQAGWVPPGERDELAALRENLRLAVDSLARIGKDRSPFLDDRAASEVGWTDVTDELARDRAAGMALWAGVKQAAADELAMGRTAAEVVEPYRSSPWHRARYLAVRAALADGLRPRNGMEGLLIDGMAQAHTMHSYWLDRHTDAESLEEWEADRRARERGEFLPPRLGRAEAIDRAALLADRFQRQFLRLMKAFRDQRRVFDTVVVAAGGQVNIAADGGQQVNIGSTALEAEGDGDGDG